MDVEATPRPSRSVPAGPRETSAGVPAGAVAGDRRGAGDPDGIYQIVAQAGKKAGVAVYPDRFRHH
jgi:hypothetical protein